MANIISESLKDIGHINDDGFIFDQSSNCIAKIDGSGYIVKTASSEICGKIEKDGTIRNAALKVVGRIQADGYVYIHSKRVCKVSSKFIESITPNAWNAGEPTTYSGRKETATHFNADYDTGHNGCLTKIIIKVIIGIVLGIIAMVNGWGGPAMLLAGPFLVFFISFIAKFFNDM